MQYKDREFGENYRKKIVHYENELGSSGREMCENESFKRKEMGIGTKL